jgi:anti-anti-sigma factor
MSSDSDIRTVRIGEHLWVVSLAGERDLADVDRLEAAFDAVFDQGSTLVVDLSETTFIDSAVIGLLVATQRRAEDDEAHRLAVVAPRGSHPRRLLDMTARNVFPIVDDLPSALATGP